MRGEAKRDASETGSLLGDSDRRPELCQTGQHRNGAVVRTYRGSVRKRKPDNYK